MKWWTLWRTKRSRERHRDPDLDLAKHMIENHEKRLQWLEHDLEGISGGVQSSYLPGADRRHVERRRRN